MRYPTYSELIFINGRLLGDEAIMTGKRQVRDLDMLLAAEQRPQASAFGEDAYPTLNTKAAALLHAIARNHPFADGNKRTATVGALFLLATNGAQIVWDQKQALQRILDMAEGRSQLDDFAAWLKTEAADVYTDPDLERDTSLIDSIIHKQKWLLDELAQR